MRFVWGASGLVNTWLCWEGGVPGEGKEAPHLLPLTPCPILLFHLALPELCPL